VFDVEAEINNMNYEEDTRENNGNEPVNEFKLDKLKNMNELMSSKHTIEFAKIDNTHDGSTN